MLITLCTEHVASGVRSWDWNDDVGGATGQVEFIDVDQVSITQPVSL